MQRDRQAGRQAEEGTVIGSKQSRAVNFSALLSSSRKDGRPNGCRKVKKGEKEKEIDAD